MQFKEPEMKSQFDALPAKLQEICTHFEEISRQYNTDPTVTRVFEPVPGDSGVHEARRAVDFRDEYVDGSGEKKTLYTAEQVNYITVTLNNLFPRNDGHMVCIHHSFHGMPYHFHLQIPQAWS
jgi:hypothetical protein